MRNVPMVLIRDPRRVALALLILYAASVSLGWLVAGEALRQGLEPGRAALNIVVVAALAALILRFVPALVFRAIFSSSLRALRAMSESRWADAAAQYEAHLADVERRPGLERLRTLL